MAGLDNTNAVCTPSTGLWSRAKYYLGLSDKKPGENCTPTPAKKEVTITSEGNSLNAKVCVNNECRQTILYEFQGAAASTKATQSATTLQKLVDNRAFYLTSDNNSLTKPALEITKDKDKLIYTKRWALGIIPFTTETILDVSDLGQNREEELGSFLKNFSSSGLLPTSEEILESKINTLERELFWRRHKDPRLEAKLSLASLYLQNQKYPEAINLVQEIIDFDLTFTAARPAFYDEAVFLQVDAMRIKAMKDNDPAPLAKAIDLLLKKEENLQSEERGYLARYNLELLKTCVVAKQFFPTEKSFASTCSVESANNYRQAATFGLNKYTPTFADNFLAVRSMLRTGEVKIASGDFQGAEEEFKTTLNFVKLIGRCDIVTDGQADEKLAAYSPYFLSLDTYIADYLGPSAALFSFARRCEVGRVIRGDLPGSPSGQFNPTNFKIFEAQAYQGLGAINQLNYQKNPTTNQDQLQRALVNYQTAFAKVKELQKSNLATFFSGFSEERIVYYNVLTEYAEALFKAYAANSQASEESLQLAETLAKEVVDQKANDKLDLTHLRALFLLGEIALQKGKIVDAKGLFAQVEKKIADYEKQSNKLEPLPPYYQTIKENASKMSWLP